MADAVAVGQLAQLCQQVFPERRIKQRRALDIRPESQLERAQPCLLGRVQHELQPHHLVEHRPRLGRIGDGAITECSAGDAIHDETPSSAELADRVDARGRQVVPLEH